MPHRAMLPSMIRYCESTMRPPSATSRTGSSSATVVVATAAARQRSAACQDSCGAVSTTEF